MFNLTDVPDDLVKEKDQLVLTSVHHPTKSKSAHIPPSCSKTEKYSEFSGEVNKLICMLRATLGRVILQIFRRVLLTTSPSCNSAATSCVRQHQLT